MNVAIIPARSGSKRILKKNIRNFSGKPIIYWSIKAAVDSGLFSRVIVSTDSEAIAEVARQSGACVPFKRPESLSGDHAIIADVVAHSIEQEVASCIDNVCCILATAPFISVDDLKESFSKFQECNADYCFSAVEYNFPVQRSFYTDGGSVKMFFPGEYKTRSQDLKKSYHDAAQFYWGKRSAWLAKDIIFSERSQAYIIDQERVCDIDTPEDWKRAERMAEILGYPR